CFDDLCITRAPADISADRVLYRLSLRVRFAFEERRKSHHEAGSAESALNTPTADHRLLQHRGNLAVRDSFYRPHRSTATPRRGVDARINRKVIDQDRARPALPFQTTLFTAPQTHSFAQSVEE